MTNFINLNENEKIMVLNWRNNKRVRENMYSNNIISKQEHFKFIESLVTSNTKKYFLVDELGVIYFNKIKHNTAEIGLYSNPEKFGIGSLLIEKILTFGFENLYLEVVDTNKKAIELYLKYQFKVITKKRVKDKNIIYMELKR